MGHPHSQSFIFVKRENICHEYDHSYSVALTQMSSFLPTSGSVYVCIHCGFLWMSFPSLTSGKLCEVKGFQAHSTYTLSVC